MTIFFCIIFQCFTFLFSFPAYGNTVQVIDTVPERSAEVKKIVEFYLTHFKIKNQKVIIFMSPRVPENFKAYLVAAYYDEDGNLGFTQVNVDNKLKGYDLVKVIAHEIYHIKQMVDKRLYFESNNSIVKWEGKCFTNIGGIPFNQRPWEKECLKRELIFASAYSRFRKNARKHFALKGQEKNNRVNIAELIIRMY